MNEKSFIRNYFFYLKINEKKKTNKKAFRRERESQKKLFGEEKTINEIFFDSKSFQQ